MRLMYAILLYCCYAPTFGQESKNATSNLAFTGVYTGLNIGTQNVFGGSFVNNSDILAQESRFVTELILGYRRQFLKERLVAGLEFQLGFLDGQLQYDDPSIPLHIDYSTKTQNGIGITLGSVFGQKKDFALFAYVNETTRKFEVKIQQNQTRFSQMDEQGMLKYGLGMEYHIYKVINVRTTFGAMNVDFGSLATNIDVEDKYDFTIGIIIQL